MKHFTDRIFHLERRDQIVHIAFLTSGVWALHVLSEDGRWSVEEIADSYDELYTLIRHFDPNVLLQEEWHGA